MQTDLLKKTNSSRNISVQNNNLQNGSLSDDLMQELAQRKTSLESLARDDLNANHSGTRSNADAANAAQANTLRDCVEQTLCTYFSHLDGQPVTNIYEMVLCEVEAPLLEVVMRYTQHNQCKAAELLGLSRGTLRKKLQQHGML